MHEVIVPKLNTNDESCVLRDWLVADAARVAEGDLIAVLETSKATYDLQSDFSGVIERSAEEGEEFYFGAIIARVFDSEKERDDFGKSPAVQDADGGRPSYIVTAGARALVERHNISADQLATLGKKAIKKADVESLLAADKDKATSKQAPDPEGVVTLTRRQLSIAKTVTHSHTTIPAAFLAVKIYCDNALDALKEFSKRNKVMAGLPEFLLKTVAGNSTEYPFFFGKLLDDERFLPAADPGVGVTMDFGKGLSIPVVRCAASRPFKDIVKEILGFREKALRDEFRAEELAGGHISISINMNQDVVCVVPIVLPGQTCMLSIASIQTELTADKKSNLSTRRFTTLGVTYDHRVINGFEAVQFAQTIKAQMEKADAASLA